MRLTRATPKQRAMYDPLAALISNRGSCGCRLHRYGWFVCYRRGTSRPYTECSRELVTNTQLLCNALAALTTQALMSRQLICPSSPALRQSESMNNCGAAQRSLAGCISIACYRTSQSKITLALGYSCYCFVSCIFSEQSGDAYSMRKVTTRHNAPVDVRVELNNGCTVIYSHVCLC